MGACGRPEPAAAKRTPVGLYWLYRTTVEMRRDVLTDVLWFVTLAVAFMTMIGPLWLYYSY